MRIDEVQVGEQYAAAGERLREDPGVFDPARRLRVQVLALERPPGGRHRMARCEILAGGGYVKLLDVRVRPGDEVHLPAAALMCSWEQALSGWEAHLAASRLYAGHDRQVTERTARARRALQEAVGHVDGYVNGRPLGDAGERGVKHWLALKVMPEQAHIIAQALVGAVAEPGPGGTPALELKVDWMSGEQLARFTEQLEQLAGAVRREAP